MCQRSTSVVRGLLQQQGQMEDLSTVNRQRGREEAWGARTSETTLYCRTLHKINL